MRGARAAGGACERHTRGAGGPATPAGRHAPDSRRPAARVRQGSSFEHEAGAVRERPGLSVPERAPRAGRARASHDADRRVEARDQCARPDPSFWAKRLGLTEAQRRRAVEVSTRTGWRDCHLQLRSVPFGAPWSAERCRPSFAVFWRDFAALLTKDQLARLEADERAVEEYTGIRVRTLYRAD